MRKYYQLVTNEAQTKAVIDIYGDITSWEWFDSDVSSYTLSKELESLPATITEIDVHINSYGGEVAEGWAIRSALKNHKAKITTYCDGFACSIASVIFTAGDERIMSDVSLLMVHNVLSYAGYANPEELRKIADDAEKMSEMSLQAYMNCGLTITEEEMKALMDAESWISPTEALEMGLATAISGDTESGNYVQSVKKKAMETLLAEKSTAKVPEIEVTEVLKKELTDEDDPEEPDEVNNKEITSKEKYARFFMQFCK